MKSILIRKKHPSHLRAPWGSIVIAFVFLLFSAGGGWLTFKVASDIYFSRMSMSWPQAQGRIVYSANGSLYYEDNLNNPKRCYGKIVYEYDVAGVSYNGTRFAFVGSHPPRLAAKVYPVGKVVKVFYDPALPARAVLQRGGNATGIDPMLYLWVGLFSFLVFGACLFDGIFSGLFFGVSSCETSSVVEPPGLSVSADHRGNVIITIFKSRLSGFFNIRAYVVVWLLVCVFWMMTEGRVAWYWTLPVSFAVVLLAAGIRYVGAPRVILQLGCRSVSAVSALGSEADSSSAWLSGDITVPIKDLRELLCNGRTLTIGDGGRLSYKNMIKMAGLSKAEIMWVAALLQVLYERYRAIEPSLSPDPSESDDNSGSMLRMYGFSGIRDLLSKVQLHGYQKPCD